MRKLVLFVLISFSTDLFAETKLDWQADFAERDLRAKAQSHCVNEERVVFTCKIGKKVASICASRVLDDNQGYMQYRFGEIRNVEVEIPAKQDYKPSEVGYLNVLSASGYANYVRFLKGSYRYYVFSASVRGSDDPKSGASTRNEPSGVVAMKNGKTVYARRCSSPAFDHNVGVHFWGNAVVTLDFSDDENPFDIAFLSKP